MSMMFCCIVGKVSSDRIMLASEGAVARVEVEVEDCSSKFLSEGHAEGA